MLGAIIGAAVFGVLDAASHIASRSYVFGWYAYRPRRYIDYLPVPGGSAMSWWAILLVAVGIGVVVSAAVGTVATLAGFRLNREPRTTTTSSRETSEPGMP